MAKSAEYLSSNQYHQYNNQPAGLEAENLNIAPVLTDTLLHNLFLGINSTGHMPEDLCIGAITSIPKKDKDYSLPSNHRGTTVTSTIEKVYENASLIATEQTCPTPLSDMQFGLALLALLRWPQSLCPKRLPMPCTIKNNCTLCSWMLQKPLTL